MARGPQNYSPAGRTWPAGRRLATLGLELTEPKVAHGLEWQNLASN